MGKLSINLLETSFTIQANEETEYLEKLLSHYSKIIEDVQQIQSVKTPLQTSILAGIMLCDELYKSQTSKGKNQSSPIDNDYNSKKVQDITNKLIEKINKVL